jgi:hypothetical protein
VELEETLREVNGTRTDGDVQQHARLRPSDDCLRQGLLCPIQCFVGLLSLIGGELTQFVTS